MMANRHHSFDCSRFAFSFLFPPFAFPSLSLYIAYLSTTTLILFILSIHLCLYYVNPKTITVPLKSDTRTSSKALPTSLLTRSFISAFLIGGNLDNVHLSPFFQSIFLFRFSLDAH